MLAQRMNAFTSSGTARARTAAKEAAARGREIIDLSAGEIWAPPPPTVQDAAIEAIRQGVNRYTDTIGLPELRQAIAERVAQTTGLSWQATEIAVTAGAKQALFHAALALLDPGDEVIIPLPHWSTFPAQVTLADGRPVFVETRHTGYAPDLADIAGAITPATRAIIVNSPNNPTGAVYSAALLAGIAELALQHGFWIILDACYDGFVYATPASAHLLALAPQAQPLTLIVNAFSKQLALTGWRLGYLAGPRPVIEAAKALQSHTTSNPNVIAQHAVLAHLQGGDQSYERALRARLHAARNQGLAILDRLEDIPHAAAEGGFYFYLDLAPLLRQAGAACPLGDADDVAALLLREAGVAAVPGSAFGDPAGLRLSYGVPEDLLVTGLTRLVDTLNAQGARRATSAAPRPASAAAALS